jgi:hypothetical protein
VICVREDRLVEIDEYPAADRRERLVGRIEHDPRRVVLTGVERVKLRLALLLPLDVGGCAQESAFGIMDLLLRKDNVPPAESHLPHVRVVRRPAQLLQLVAVFANL